MSFPALRYFHETEAITKTKNHLPHWQQEGACYFVTFHLADSLPDTLLQQWRNEREAWLSLHPQPWTPVDSAEYAKRFRGRRERWLDAGHGSCCLHENHADTVHQALLHFDGDRYSIHAATVMPNHVHVLFTLHSSYTLEKAVSSWKSFSARRINEQLGQRKTLWQKDYFDRMIRDLDHFCNVAWYIKRNPTKGRAPNAPLYVAPWVGELLGLR